MKEPFVWKADLSEVRSLIGKVPWHRGKCSMPQPWCLMTPRSVHFRLRRGCFMSLRVNHLRRNYNAVRFLESEWWSNKELWLLKVIFKIRTVLVWPFPLMTFSGMPTSFYCYLNVSSFFIFLRLFILYHLLVSDTMIPWEKQAHARVTQDRAFLSPVCFEHLLIVSLDSFLLSGPAHKGEV